MMMGDDDEEGKIESEHRKNDERNPIEITRNEHKVSSSPHTHTGGRARTGKKNAMRAHFRTGLLLSLLEFYMYTYFLRSLFGRFDGCASARGGSARFATFENDLESIGGGEVDPTALRAECHIETRRYHKSKGTHFRHLASPLARPLSLHFVASKQSFDSFVEMIFKLHPDYDRYVSSLRR